MEIFPSFLPLPTWLEGGTCGAPTPPPAIFRFCRPSPPDPICVSAVHPLVRCSFSPPFFRCSPVALACSHSCWLPSLVSCMSAAHLVSPIPRWLAESQLARGVIRHGAVLPLLSPGFSCMPVRPLHHPCHITHTPPLLIDISCMLALRHPCLVTAASCCLWQKQASPLWQEAYQHISFMAVSRQKVGTHNMTQSVVASTDVAAAVVCRSLAGLDEQRAHVVAAGLVVCHMRSVAQRECGRPPAAAVRHLLLAVEVVEAHRVHHLVHILHTQRGCIGTA